MDALSETTFLSQEEKDNVFEIISAISELQKQSGKSYITYNAIARQIKGAESFHDWIAGMCAIPFHTPLFIQTKNQVALTEASHKVLNGYTKKILTTPEQIAQFVAQYGGSLPKINLKIEDLIYVQSVSGRHVHILIIELGDIIIANETPVTVRSQEFSSTVRGKIVGQDAENNRLYVALDSKLSSLHLPALLYVEKGYLYHQLSDALRELPEIPMHGRFFSEREENNLPIYSNDSQKVALMLANLKPPWSRFLWGPPGAGKTYGLALLIAELLRKYPHERFLILATSNTAVDVALAQLVEHLEQMKLDHLLSERKILRFGYPRKSEILSRPDLLGTEKEKEISARIANSANKLEMMIKQGESEEKIAVNRAELLGLQESLKNLVHEHMAQCSVVATTTAMCLTPNIPIRTLNWDTIIVDEVTMVPPAMCIYLSSLAQKRFLLAGDPRQLGPVYEQNSQHSEGIKKWLGLDVFELAQLSSGTGEQRHIHLDDERLVRITTQRRCAADIWQPIAHLYQQVNSDVSQELSENLCLFTPAKGHGIAIIDTGQALTNAKCQKSSKSWYNIQTAECSAKLANSLFMQANEYNISISIITPYRAQQREITKWLKNLGINQQVSVGTVHQFQGSESDIVIFDVVDGQGRKKIGNLLRGDTGVRLVNVAISRARGKFFVLADISWCHKAMNRDDNTILWDVVFKYGKQIIDLTL